MLRPWRLSAGPKHAIGSTTPAQTSARLLAAANEHMQFIGPNADRFASASNI